MKLGLVAALLLSTIPRPAPPLEWKTAEGQVLSLRAHRGKTVVIQFFSPG